MISLVEVSSPMFSLSGARLLPSDIPLLFLSLVFHGALLSIFLFFFFFFFLFISPCVCNFWDVPPDRHLNHRRHHRRSWAGIFHGRPHYRRWKTFLTFSFSLILIMSSDLTRTMERYSLVY
ncbi:hypothetical protein BDW42DRAFT_173396, partial [Aspergillus taichungensis]